MTQDSTTTPAVEMEMQPAEFAELRTAAASVGQQDVKLGLVLDLIILHLAHAHGLDPTAEDARIADEAFQAARAAEDQRILDEAEALKEKRAAEDAQPREAAQLEALKQARAAEEVQIAADAEALTKKREEEDAAAQAAKDAAAAQAEQNAQASAAPPTQVEAPALVVAPDASSNGGKANGG